MRLISVALTCLLGLATAAGAQNTAPQKEVRAKSGKDSRIAVFANVRPDCTSGPLPTIRLVNAPEQGKIIVKKAKVSGTNIKQCLSFTVVALVVIYRAPADFQGADSAVIEIKSAGGKTLEQRYTIRVSKDGGEREI
jgi:hypothetical protein